MESKDNVQQEQPTQGTATKVQMSTRVEEKKKANKKNKIRSTIANSIVFIILIAGFYWLVREYFHIGDKDYTEAAQVEEFINPVNTRVAGYIKEIKFIEHQQVKKGDTLLILDDREIQTQLGQAEAAYQNALAQRSATSSSVNTVSNNVNVMESNIAGAKARLWNAEQNLNRYKNLLAAEAVTRQQYDQIKTEYDAQKAAYETLVNQKQSANLSTTEVKSKLGINDAEIKRTKAALDMAKLNLSYTIITAPYDGVMGRRVISDGQLVQAGQQIATIVLNGQKWVTANFLESQMPKIAIGKKIMMSADALGGQQFEGEVTAISAATGSRYSSVPTDNSTGNFIKVQQRIPVRIEFTSGNDKQKLNQLRAGMNMIIKLKD
ncbi:MULTISPECIES: HlyD family secretion protein [Elizabethkingia]|uniref:Membrane fusion component of tripartite multidrug resistance system n=1 Tax=Elizabethkingia anophelis NUHP1 TaxID=1338011 RepID=A0A077EL96_9FLAO|nr:MULTISPECIES: HlyD family secretion protein [Elizabethkingia]AIL46210.1 Membrane fusion component of tripartite multidrug resistance system [Elizabethkingia anophelis NUHP1]MBE9394267.1 HlyD family secretion protein [Elizabethkingia anophelis]MBE9406389.1 HlyD family secretion protein [Elizabethkingia anophelis]MCT3662134.1 HlyD family secretion protein [Elizabethkingia anophelis]MCT3801757.1 HlyD family secretion protein [Elizabethkingia anophelis]